MKEWDILKTSMDAPSKKAFDLSKCIMPSTFQKYAHNPARGGRLGRELSNPLLFQNPILNLQCSTQSGPIVPTRVLPPPIFPGADSAAAINKANTSKALHLSHIQGQIKGQDQTQSRN